MGYNGKKSLKTWVTSHFLGKSDRAADAALLGGKPPEYYAGPVNLLDNSYFEIAQAGYGGMHGNNRYAADRWQNMFQFGVFSAANPGIVMTYATNHAYAVQKIANSERYVGKMLTFGVMTDEYGLLLCTGLYTGTTLVARFAADTHEISIADDSVRVVVVSGTLTVRWAALYEGVYTADTFPPPAPQPYSVGLAECRRWYLPLDASKWYEATRPFGDVLRFEILGDFARAPTLIGSIRGYGNDGVWHDLAVTSVECRRDRTIFRLPGMDSVATPGMTYILTGASGVSCEL